MALRFDRPGLWVSGAAHAGILLAALVAFTSEKLPDADEGIPVEVITDNQLSEMTKGQIQAAKVLPDPKPRADRVAETRQERDPGEAKQDAPAPPKRPAEMKVAEEETQAPSPPPPQRTAEAKPEANVPPPPSRSELAKAAAQADKAAAAQAEKAAEAKAAEAKQAALEKAEKLAEQKEAEAIERAKVERAKADAAKAEAAKVAKAQADAKVKLAALAKAKADEAREKAEAEADAKAALDAKLKALADAKAEAERQKKLADAKAKAAADAKAVADAKAEAEAERRQELADAKAKAEAEAKARKQAELASKFSAGDIRQLLASKAPSQSTGATGREVQKTASLGTAAGASQRLNPSQRDQLVGLLSEQLHRCWQVPIAAQSADKPPVPTVRVKLNQDGTLAGEPVVTNASSDPLFRTVAESATRATRRCAPLRIPAQFMPFYADWHDLVVNFDPREV